MCGCNSNFEGNDVNDDLLSFDGGGSWTDFVDDVESGEKFDNFLTKKGRERRRVRKEAQAGGMSKEEAKAYALEQVPRQKLKELLAKLKSGASVLDVTTPSGNVRLSSDPATAMNEVSDALANSGAGRSADILPENDDDKPSFFEQNKWLIIGAVVVVGGFFAYRTFVKK